MTLKQVSKLQVFFHSLTLSSSSFCYSSSSIGYFFLSFFLFFLGGGGGVPLIPLSVQSFFTFVLRKEGKRAEKRSGKPRSYLTQTYHQSRWRFAWPWALVSREERGTKRVGVDWMWFVTKSPSVLSTYGADGGGFREGIAPFVAEHVVFGDDLLFGGQEGGVRKLIVCLWQSFVVPFDIIPVGSRSSGSPLYLVQSSGQITWQY